MDSASLIIYPEIKATEVAFSALKRYLCSFYFRIDNETGRIQRNTLYISYRGDVPSVKTIDLNKVATVLTSMFKTFISGYHTIMKIRKKLCNPITPELEGFRRPK